MMTAAARRTLIERPFPVVRRFGTSYPWAGALIANPSLEEHLAGTLTPYLDDSTQLRYRMSDVAMLTTRPFLKDTL